MKKKKLKVFNLIIFLVFVLLICIVPLKANAAETENIMVIVRASSEELNHVNKILEDKNVSGIILYIGWRTLQPKENEYNWKYIDEIAGKTAKAKKKFHLAVTTGRWVPQWIYSKGVKTIRWKSKDSYTENGIEKDELSPIPWDPIFLDLWDQAIHALALHFKNNRRPDLVMITGPSMSSGLEATISLPLESLNLIRYTEDLFVGAWIRSINIFTDAFQGTKMALAVHDQVGPIIYGRPVRSISASRKIISYANHMISGGFYPMLLCLTEDSWFSQSNKLVNLATSNKPFALQLIRIHSGTQNAETNFRAAVEKGFRLGASWVEIFCKDFGDKTIWNAYTQSRQ